MIYIYDFFHMIAIDDKSEFCIYSNDYQITIPQLNLDDDDQSISVNYSKAGRYSYGDLIILTKYCRYTFTEVYSAYHYANEIIMKIIMKINNEHRDNICIRLDEINPYWFDHFAGDFIVEHM